MLDQIIDEQWLQAKAVFGFFPAAAFEDQAGLPTSAAQRAEKRTSPVPRSQSQWPSRAPVQATARAGAPCVLGLGLAGRRG